MERSIPRLKIYIDEIENGFIVYANQNSSGEIASFQSSTRHSRNAYVASDVSEVVSRWRTHVADQRKNPDDNKREGGKDT